MARKRGGLAGLYDRNKGKFRTAGTLVGTGLGALVGGPAGAKIGGTLAGAAFRGFDRPGKGGIGFDVSQGLQGAAEGYGTAALATGAYGGIKNLFSPNISGAMNRASGLIGQANQQIAANPAFGGMAGGAGGYGGVGSMPGIGFGLGGMQPPVAGGPVTSTDYIGRSVNQFLAQGGSTAPSASGAFGRAAADRAFGDLGMSLSDVANANKSASSGGGRLQGLLRGFRENKDLISMAGKGIMAGMPDRGEEAAMMRAETERMMFEDEKAQREARQRALQQYFMPLLGQIQQERQGMSFGPMYRG